METANIANEIMLKQKEKLESIFGMLNFSTSETQQHLEEISIILTARIVASLLEKKGFQASQDNGDGMISQFINENYTNEEIGSVVKSESDVFLSNYFGVILKDVEEEKLEDIERVINQK